MYGPWADRLPAHTELLAVRLPGRENRLRERPPQDWPSLARDFASALTAQVPSPYLLFGHSMGAMLVYETVIRTLARPPVRVLLSGCRAPHVPRALPAIHGLPPERFHAELGRLAGTSADVLADPRLMALLGPTLRADIRLAETWAHAAPDPLPVPVTAFCGTDDEVAPPEAVAAWRTLAPHGFRGHRVEGGHFYPYERAHDLLGALADEISLCLAERRRSDAS